MTTGGPGLAELRALIGHEVQVQTSRGPLAGTLHSVSMTHLWLDSDDGEPLFVRRTHLQTVTCPHGTSLA